MPPMPSGRACATQAIQRRVTHAAPARLARSAVLTQEPFVRQTAARWDATGARAWQIK
jgi:hypothetical protein